MILNFPCDFEKCNYNENLTCKNPKFEIKMLELDLWNVQLEYAICSFVGDDITIDKRFR